MAGKEKVMGIYLLQSPEYLYYPKIGREKKEERDGSFPPYFINVMIHDDPLFRCSSTTYDPFLHLQYKSIHA
jgi:hypothetical protein